MTVAELTGNFNNNKTFSKEALKAIQEDSDLRGSLVKWFRNNSDRGFAIALLNTFKALRQAGDEIPGEDIMLSAYILGLHDHIEDSLKIWNAKNTDFDSFAMIDVQLVVFAGVQETLSFLKNNKSDEAAKAYKYIEMCMKSGDFDDLATYFSDEETPWYV